METSTAISNARNLGEVVEIINGPTWRGDLTDSQLAGQYAFEASSERGTVDDDNLLYDLEVLKQAGAKFDTEGALEHAKALAGA